MRNLLFLVNLFGLFLLAGTVQFSCQNKKKPFESTAFITVTDDLGRKIKIPENPTRILGLAPSATEMLFAVADTQTIVGRTQNCNYPAAALRKPVVNNYPMDYEALLLLKPQIVFTTDGITPLEVAAKLERELHIPVYYQKFEKIDDIFKGLTTIGKIMHRETQAKTVTDSLRLQLQTLKASNINGVVPTVLAITWSDPIYVYGQNTLFTDKLKLIGARNAVTEVFAQSYPALTREYILKLNPDYIIGGSFSKMDSTFFKMYPELKKIKAYRDKNIFAATDDLMSRPSPRVVEAVRELKNLIK